MRFVDCLARGSGVSLSSSLSLGSLRVPPTPTHARVPKQRLSKKQPSQRNAPNPIVDPSCPLHGTNAHVHAAETTTAAATHGVTPASRRPVEGGVPASPVSTRFFTPVASHGPGALALTTPATRAGAAPAEDEHEPASTYVRSKRGGIRKTGLQLLRPARAYVVGQPATLTVEIRNAQPKPLAEGAQLLLLDNGYFAEAALPLPEVRCGVVYRGGCKRDRQTVSSIQKTCTDRGGPDGDGGAVGQAQAQHHDAQGPQERAGAARVAGQVCTCIDIFGC